MHGENPWRVVFLGSLEATGNVSEAARRAGVHRATPYGARGADSAFREVWDQALEAATDALEGEARRRALEGWQEPVFWAGEICGHIGRYDSRLLMFLLQAPGPRSTARTPASSTRETGRSGSSMPTVIALDGSGIPMATLHPGEPASPAWPGACTHFAAAWTIVAPCKAPTLTRQGRAFPGSDCFQIATSLA